MEKPKSLESMRKTKSKINSFARAKTGQARSLSHTHTHTQTKHQSRIWSAQSERYRCQNLWTKPVWQKMWLYQQFSEETHNGIAVNAVNCTTHQNTCQNFYIRFI